MAGVVTVATEVTEEEGAEEVVMVVSEVIFEFSFVLKILLSVLC